MNQHTSRQWIVVVALIIAAAPFANATELMYRGSDGQSHPYIAPQRTGEPYIETYGVARGGSGPTFNVEYLEVTNNTNSGFDDPTLGATRRATVAAVFAYLGTVLDESGSADIQVQFSQFDGSGFLASAGPLYFIVNNCQEGLVFQHITTGVDPISGTPDGYMQVDFGYNWNNDLSAPAPSEIDLFTVVLHELTHALGFLSLTDANGGGLNGLNPDTRAAGFDGYVQNGNGVSLINCANGLFVGTSNDLRGFNNGVKHAGSNVVAEWHALGNSGNAPLYAPSTYAPGSSTSHWDTNNPNVPATAIMRHQLPLGGQIREYHALDLAALKDLGYMLAAPSPGPGDLDGDGDSDLDDHAGFVDCLAGPNNAPSPTAPTSVQDCRDAFDFDSDNDVDLADFDAFLLVFGS
ncbi:MAG: hypothetical protein H6817_02665 [Phycisphaerales bacterium]|nr:hypothetical protein [Phycisphaerales bacterium]